MFNEINQRNFVVFLKETKINPDLKLNNLSGEGRIDLVCRIISSTFFLSNSFRINTNLFLFFQSESILLILYGDKIKNLMPDERSIGGFLKSIFRYIYGQDSKTNTLNRGFSWQYFSLEDFPVCFPIGYILDKEGEEINHSGDKEKFKDIYILGDHLGLNDKDQSFLVKFKKISLGNKELHASSCITIIHHILDL